MTRQQPMAELPSTTFETYETPHPGREPVGVPAKHAPRSPDDPSHEGGTMTNDESGRTPGASRCGGALGVQRIRAGMVPQW